MPRSADRPLPFGRLQNHRAAPSPEQYAGAAIVPVEDARERLRADDQRGLSLAGLDEIVGGRQTIDKPLQTAWISKAAPRVMPILA